VFRNSIFLRSASFMELYYRVASITAASFSATASVLYVNALYYNAGKEVNFERIEKLTHSSHGLARWKNRYDACIYDAKTLHAPKYQSVRVHNCIPVT
jgi:hypothetical protein